VPRAVDVLGSALRWPPLLAFALTLASLLILLVVATTAYAGLHGSSALPGVTVGGVPVGGLDRAAAEARLRAALPALDGGYLYVRVDGTQRPVPYAAIGRDYAFAAMLDRAFAVGRSGGIFENLGEQLQTLGAGTDIAPEVTWNESALMAALTQVAAVESIPAADAAVEHDVANGYSVTPAQSGRAIDLAKLRASAVAGISRPVAGDTTINIAPTVVQPRVPTTAAEDAVSRFNAATAGTIVASGGGMTIVLDSPLLRSWVSLQPSPAGLGWDVVVDRAAIDSYFAPYASQIDRPPKDASFEMTADGVAPIAGVTGQAFSLPDTVEGVAQFIAERGAGSSGSSVELAVTTTDPTFTTEQATVLAGQIQMVSSWTTRFIPGISNFNGENIRVPAKILNGTIVEPGERFSFLDAIGEISPENGFGLGGAIIRGHTREQGAMGGGICSASTTMFNAALRYGYQIDARTQHAYYIDRYPVGLDATVFRSAGQTVDMAFTNDSQYPLWIRGFARRAKVTFQIWTIPDGRTVRLGKADVSNRRPAEDTTVVVDTMKPGTSKRVEYPVDGFDATVVRIVYDASGAVLHTDTFNSHYIVVTGVTQVGPTPEPPPTEPPPTEPPPTEPPPAP
jgi:vancomycin resistance protein YoaR